MTSHRSLVAPMSRLLFPRPAIQAWRGARCFATQLATGDSVSTMPESMSMPPPPTVDGPYDPQASTSIAIEESPLNAQIPVLPGQQTTSSTTSNEPKRRMPVGVVVSSGKMHKTVKVRIPGQEWNSYLRKMYKSHTSHLVHDPNSSLHTGDVISLRPHKAAKHVHHVVHQIVTPFGLPIDQRPAVPTEEEMKIEYDQMRARKEERRRTRVKEQLEKGLQTQSVKGEQLLGSKGQRIPEGVLPGGKHAVGKIQERAQGNKQKAVRRNERAEKNLLQAKQVAEETEP